MDTKEIRIECPEGYEIDKENSTFEQIKFKPIERWKDSNLRIDGWRLDGNGIRSKCYLFPWKNGNLDIFVTKKQAKSALAMAQISQIMANDERFGGPITDEEWKNANLDKYVILRNNMNAINVGIIHYNYTFLAFHTDKQRDLFLKENEDLVKDYLMLD